jgi:hypothetical protein
MLRSSILLLVGTLVILSGSNLAQAIPMWDGEMATLYATATNPFEIDFDSDGTLYSGHNSPTSGAAFLYQISSGGGAAADWGSTAPQDPDGIHVFGDHVYASSEGAIWQAATSDGAMSVWATVASSPNQTTITIDEAGDYFAAGTVLVGNARFGTDIHAITPETMAISNFVSSGSLDIVRALQFVDGTLYLTEIGEDKGVWAVDSSGTPTQIDDLGHSWNTPDAMVYESATDTFLVGDQTQLLRLPRSGGPVQVVGTDFGLISGLTFNSQGQLYVADRGDDVIWQFEVPAIQNADFDENGDIDGADFLKWQRGETPEMGSAEELALWKAQYGTTVPPLSALVVSTPEPSTLLLASLVGVLIDCRRRWFRCGGAHPLIEMDVS